MNSYLNKDFVHKVHRENFDGGYSSEDDSSETTFELTYVGKSKVFSLQNFSCTKLTGKLYVHQNQITHDLISKFSSKDLEENKITTIELNENSIFEKIFSEPIQGSTILLRLVNVFDFESITYNFGIFGFDGTIIPENDVGHSKLWKNVFVNAFSGKLQNIFKVPERNDLLAIIKMFPMFLHQAPDNLKRDKEFVLEAVKSQGFSIQLASLELVRDPDIQLAAINSNPNVMTILSSLIGDNKEIFMYAIQRDIFLIQFVPKSLLNDEEIILFAVKKQGNLLQRASKQLQNNKRIVMEAVKENGNSLQYASQELQKDREILLQTMQSLFEIQDATCIKKILIETLMKDERSFMFEISQSNAFYIYFEFIELFLMIHEKGLKLPEDLLHSIAMKLKEYEIYEKNCIEIFEFEIKIGKEFKFYQESCFELAKIYLNGNEKNFEKSEKYFNENISGNFKISEVTHLLMKLQKFSNLDQEERSIFEKCSKSSSYELLKHFAHSMDAHLYYVKRKKDGKELVLKKFVVDDSRDSFNTSLKEVLFLMKLKHNLICQVEDFYIEETEEEDETKYFFCIIMEKYEQDLSKLVKNNELKEEEIVRILLDICYGIAFIHSQNIIHRDLKPGTQPII
jgi:hypothetical protein